MPQRCFIGGALTGCTLLRESHLALLLKLNARVLQLGKTLHRSRPGGEGIGNRLVCNTLRVERCGVGLLGAFGCFLRRLRRLGGKVLARLRNHFCCVYTLYQRVELG